MIYEVSEDLNSLICALILDYLAIREITRLSQVCKRIYHEVSSNDILWLKLCRNYESVNRSKYYVLQVALGFDCSISKTFLPTTKLPRHSWKDVYKQLHNYDVELEIEQNKYEENLERLRPRFEAPCPEVLVSVLMGKRDPGTLPRPMGMPSLERPGKLAGVTLPFSLDLTRIADEYMKLLSSASMNSTLFQSSDFLQQAINKYVKFLRLKHKYKQYILVPTLEIEYIWVSHMLRPSMYEADCCSLFGEVIDHQILFYDSYSCLNKVNALQDTQQLFREEYGELFCTEDLIQIQRAVEKRFRYARKIAPQILRYERSYVKEVGVVEGTLEENTSIGLRLSHLLKDAMRLSSFVKQAEDLRPKPSVRHKHAGVAHYFLLHNTLWKEYEKFLHTAAKCSPGEMTHHSPAIDVIWHAHMISPKIYAKEIQEWVGYMLDHESLPDYDAAVLGEQFLGRQQIMI